MLKPRYIIIEGNRTQVRAPDRESCREQAASSRDIAIARSLLPRDTASLDGKGDLIACNYCLKHPTFEAPHPRSLALCCKGRCSIPSIATTVVLAHHRSNRSPRPPSEQPKPTPPLQQSKPTLTVSATEAQPTPSLQAKNCSSCHNCAHQDQLQYRSWVASELQDITHIKEAKQSASPAYE